MQPKEGGEETFPPGAKSKMQSGKNREGHVVC